MESLSRFVEALRRAFGSMTSNRLQLNETAERLLEEAGCRGYKVSRVRNMGAEAILVEGSEGGKIYLWSSDDVIEYAKSAEWLSHAERP